MAPHNNINALKSWLITEFFLDSDDSDANTLMIAQQNTCAAGAVYCLKMTRDFVPKICGFAENIIPQYSFDDFRFHFRIGRSLFEEILPEFVPHLTSAHEGGILQVDPTKQLLVFLWYMSNQESMREVANTFGLSISTTHGIIYRVLDSIEGLAMQVNLES